MNDNIKFDEGVVRSALQSLVSIENVIETDVWSKLRQIELDVTDEWSGEAAEACKSAIYDLRTKSTEVFYNLKVVIENITAATNIMIETELKNKKKVEGFGFFDLINIFQK